MGIVQKIEIWPYYQMVYPQKNLSKEMRGWILCYFEIIPTKRLD